MKKLGEHWAWDVAILLLVAIVLCAIAIPNMRTGPRFPPRNACIANLKQIDGAIQQWALDNKKKDTEAPDFKEAIKYLKNGRLPKCPSGGNYNAGKTIADPPTCSLGITLGHTLPN